MEHITIEGLTLEIADKHSLLRLSDGKTFKITDPEAKVLRCLIQNYGDVISYGCLEKAGWDIEIDRNSLAVVIYKLRKIVLFDHLEIINEPRVGYRLSLKKVGDETEVIEPNNKSEYSKDKFYILTYFKYFVITFLFCVVITTCIYIKVSWVIVECQLFGSLNVCYLEGKPPLNSVVPVTTSDKVYYINSTFYEVSNGK